MHYKAATTLAGLLLAASSMSVFAHPAIATYNANLRSGPGIANPVVAIVPDQAAIDVGRCAGSWCRVNWNGVDGYLSTTLIGSGSTPGVRVIESEPSDRALVVYGDRAMVVAPNCDPSFDAACAAGYNNGYAYNDGYYGGYGYGDNSSGNYVYNNSGFYGGSFGGGYRAPRWGGASAIRTSGAVGVGRGSIGRHAGGSRVGGGNMSWGRH